MRVIVSGGSGFIGKKVCRSLLFSGHEVMSIGRSLKTENQFLQDKLYFQPYVMGENISEEIISFCPEALIHLAWEGIPSFTRHMSICNVSSQVRFLSQLNKFPQLKKIVASGSCMEYGEQTGICSEEDQIKPNTYFSWAKHTIHEFCELICRELNINLVWLRIFYVYGPGQRPESLIPSLIKAFSSNINPNINNPTAKNDFIYIDDVVDIILRTLELRKSQGTYNVGSGELTTIYEITRLVESAILKTNSFSNRFLEKIDLNNFYNSKIANISRLKEDFNWGPKIGLLDGIRSVCNEALGNENNFSC